MPPVTINNPSFESPAQAAPRGYTNVAPTNWVLLKGQGGVFRPQLGLEASSVPDGAQCLWLAGGGVLFQDLGVPVDPTSLYTPAAFVGTQLDYTPSPEGYRLELVAGGPNGTVIASTAGTLPVKSDFQQVTASGQGVGSGNLGVRISITSGGELLVDNVSLQSSVAPAPVTPPAQPASNKYPTLPPDLQAKWFAEMQAGYPTTVLVVKDAYGTGIDHYQVTGPSGVIDFAQYDTPHLQSLGAKEIGFLQILLWAAPQVAFNWVDVKPFLDDSVAALNLPALDLRTTLGTF